MATQTNAQSPSMQDGDRGGGVIWWLPDRSFIVAFADTEARSVTTAATSGAQFGMKLVLLQLLLIVPLFAVQEMTVRLGTVSGKGHAALICERYGLGRRFRSGTMLVTNFTALETEFIYRPHKRPENGVPVTNAIIARAVSKIRSRNSPSRCPRVRGV